MGFRPLFEILIEQLRDKEKYYHKFKDDFYVLLNIQYRMSEKLIEFANSKFYNSEIESFMKHSKIIKQAEHIPILNQIFSLIGKLIKEPNKINYQQQIQIFEI